jgi:hypothetical protein
MHLGKRIKTIYEANTQLCVYILLGLFVVSFALTRLPALGIDVINPDGVNWHYRSEQFVVGLKTGALEKTYQHKKQNTV